MSKIAVNILEGVTHYKVKASECKDFENKVIRKIKREMTKQNKVSQIDYWIFKENPMYTTYLNTFKRRNKWAYLNLYYNGFDIKSPEKEPNDDVNYYFINSEKILDKIGKKFFYGIRAFFMETKLKFKSDIAVNNMNRFYQETYEKDMAKEDKFDLERSAFYRQYSTHENIDSAFKKFLSKFGFQKGEYSIQEKIKVNKTSNKT